MSDTYDGDKFFVVKEGVKMATPLLLALAVIEISDVAFAVDSIPAVCLSTSPVCAASTKQYAPPSAYLQPSLSLQASYLRFLETVSSEQRER